MSDFERLHPSLQHHIVNTLGWQSLRPFQEQVLGPILDGQHGIVLAPTAGGKTEAAFFPILSRCLTEDWSGLSTLYVCPIKALLNNLDDRLAGYCRMVGRKSAVWHGDVDTTTRDRILREPPDCLLTTPESIESMLVSTRVDARTFFSTLRAVIIDEVHAFAGDDRGWHLLAVLGRIVRLAGVEIQRVGLSATVGNPQELLRWVTSGCSGQGFSSPSPPPPLTMPDVQIDYVGTLENAGLVISRLHRGEKRLVFVDSRSRAEQLGAQLRRYEVDCFVTHSSLSAPQRREAETAFANRSNCVIVATSALELGIDIGDLDRVIQIDAPSTVSSFLQRMGRTGRRAGVERNYLFLVTSDLALAQAVGTVQLWQRGFVEPVRPPKKPLQIFAQQIMALALQERGIGLANCWDWVSGFVETGHLDRKDLNEVLDWMLANEILWNDAGLLWFGEEGQTRFSRRHYSALLSVFTSPPLFRVLHGRNEVGLLDQSSFMGMEQGPRFVLLGGRSWQVLSVDWNRRVASVAPGSSRGRSRWLGQGQGLGFELTWQVRSALLAAGDPGFLSRRAAARWQDLCESGALAVTEKGTYLVAEPDRWVWWTFGGTFANAMLAGALSASMPGLVQADSFTVTIKQRMEAEKIHALLAGLKSEPDGVFSPLVDERAVKGLKFSDCLPPDQCRSVLSARLSDAPALRQVLAHQIILANESS